MLTIEKKEPSKTQRDGFGKRNDFTFQVDGTPILKIEKWLYFHITSWPTDLSLIAISDFVSRAKRSITLKYHHLGLVEITCDIANLKKPFLQIASNYDLSDEIPDWLTQSCTVKNLPLEEIEKELKAKYATYPVPLI